MLQTSKEEKMEVDGEQDTKTVITSDMVEKVPEQQQDHEAWIGRAKRQLFDAVKLLRDSAGKGPPASCYTPSCQAGDASSCYSPTCAAREAQDTLTKASTIYQGVCKEGRTRDLMKLEFQEPFKTAGSATAGLTQVVKLLLHKEKELAEQTIQVIAKPKEEVVKEEEVKSEVKEEVKQEPGASSPGKSLKRCYSVEDTSGKLYLKRIQSVAESKKTSRIVKYPLAPSFWSTSRRKRNILIINKHDLRKLARNFGITSSADGFNSSAKANNTVWPYPCSRPSFRTSWLYRTASMASLHAVAMQLRILWMCLRWDDMVTKAPTGDGKNQVTTDHEIVTTEILKHRSVGRYLEQTQYFQRKISIPLDQPRKQVDYSPIRSGLRKRKRPESPVNADPRVEEIWIDELDLELWEIKAYRDRCDREKSAVATRRQAGTTIRAPEKFDPSDMERSRRVLGSASLADLKAKTEESMKEQRAAFKAGRSSTPEIPALTVRRQEPRLISSKGLTPSTPSTAKKIFISKDGKIIGHQASNAMAAPPGKVAIPSLASKPQPSAQQKVQIVKSADGKIQVRGLLPGQQLVQMPDGKLQIFSSQSASPLKPGPGAKVLGGNTLPQQAITTTTSQPSLLPKPSLPSSPSPSKTYCIQRNPAVASPTVTPIQPKPVPAPPVVPALATPTTAAPGTSNKQNMVVGIQSLGANTVTIKDGQLIVQGPDHAAATNIAKLLSTGAAKLANLNGKQVMLVLFHLPMLLSSSPAPISTPDPT